MYCAASESTITVVFIMTESSEGSGLFFGATWPSDVTCASLAALSPISKATAGSAGGCFTGLKNLPNKKKLMKFDGFYLGPVFTFQLFSVH